MPLKNGVSPLKHLSAKVVAKNVIQVHNQHSCIVVEHVDSDNNKFTNTVVSPFELLRKYNNSHTYFTS